MAKLSMRELVCAEVLVGKGRSVRSVARELGVDESTLRYRLQRRAEGVVDGRTQQAEACDPFAGVIEAWISRQNWDGEAGRPESIRSLYETLVAEHGYVGSYKAVVRFVRRRAPAPKLRPVRRVETRPGAQAQVDWGTRKVFVHELGGLTPLSVFLMTLSHSRLSPVRFYLDETQLSWLDGHNRGFGFLGGVPLTVRIDNLKVGVKRGAGAWAELNDAYLAYADQLGFVIDPARPRCASDKGKVERRVQDVIGGIICKGERFVTLEDLNEAAAERILERAKKLINPVTGDSVYDTWLVEREALQALPEALPVPFDVQVTRKVGRDCLVSFEGRQYAAPFTHAGKNVQVRGAPGTVQIIANGRVVQEYPRGTKARLLIDQACYDPATASTAEPAVPGVVEVRVEPPAPLGRIGRVIVADKSWEAARRPLSEYETLLRSQS